MVIYAILLFTILAIVPAAAFPADIATGDSHPQTLVAVQGMRRLNLFCVGTGRPTVLLESGSGGSTADWWHVQGQLARITRTCAYDRAGYGYSDPSRQPSDAQAATDDLHRLIEVAHLGPRPVIVGHSNGGLYATLFAQRFPGQLGGLVLVDPGYPGQQDYAQYGLAPAHVAALRDWGLGLIAGARHCLAAARQNALGTSADHSDCTSTPADDPLALRTALRDLYVGVTYQATNLSEFDCSFGADRNGETADDKVFPSPLRSLGSLPLIVLTAEHHPVPILGFSPDEQFRFWTVWKQGHDRLARLSSAGTSQVVAGSGHFIQNDKPDAVYDAVAEVVATARTSRSGQ